MKLVRNSLNTAAGQSRADGRPEDDVNSLERDFENATNQLNDQFKRRRAGAADVRNVLQKASPINDFISRRRFDAQTQNDWASVRSNPSERHRSDDSGERPEVGRCGPLFYEKLNGSAVI